MAQGRNTGAGKVDLVVWTGNRPPGWPFNAALLHNYNIDGDEPKPEHKKWLITKLIPFLRLTPVKVEIDGYTSRSGSAAHDLDLSIRRVTKVRHFLTSHGAPANKVRAIDDHGYGKRYSVAISNEEEAERAVLIKLLN